jgi:hypothetical protein
LFKINCSSWLISGQCANIGYAWQNMAQIDAPEKKAAAPAGAKTGAKATDFQMERAPAWRLGCDGQEACGARRGGPATIVINLLENFRPVKTI